MKNWERFADWDAACEYYEQHCVPALSRLEWCKGAWLYMDYVENESRLDFLRRCDNAAFGTSTSILTSVGSKELKRLEKKEAAQ
jgi:hypothetical protein